MKPKHKGTRENSSWTLFFRHGRPFKRRHSVFSLALSLAIMLSPWPCGPCLPGNSQLNHAKVCQTKGLKGGLLMRLTWQIVWLWNAGPSVSPIPIINYKTKRGEGGTRKLLKEKIQHRELPFQFLAEYKFRKKSEWKIQIFCNRLCSERSHVVQLYEMFNWNKLKQN